MDRSVLLLAVVAVGAAGLALVRARPRLAVVLWFVVVCFVPTWLEAKLGVLIPPTTLVAVGVVVAFVSLRGQPRLTLADALVGALLAVCLVGAIVGGSGSDALFALLTRWLVPFLLGRVLLNRVPVSTVYRTAAVTFGIVALLAVAEFLTKTNLFVLIRADNVDYDTWSPLQERGGVLRVEGAFGHSIALGASMAMALPLVLATTWRFTVKLALVALVLVAEVFTFSRLGIICSALAIVLFVLFSRDGLTKTQRTGLGVGVIIAGVLAAPMLLANFDRAGPEASISAEYRSQLTDLIPDMSVLGPAGNAYRTPTGELYFGSFRSIDNALILLGLTYGLLALAVAVGVLVALVVTVVRRRGNPAMIALATQIPAVATVALITQYEMFVWFMAGLACAMVAARPDDGGPTLLSPPRVGVRAETRAVP